MIGEGFDYIHMMVLLLTASGARGERNNIGVVSHSMVKTTEANKRLKKKTNAKPAGLVWLNFFMCRAAFFFYQVNHYL